MSAYDAIVVGAGHNGLVTALYLARAGWKTLVLERNPTIGGATRSSEVTLPGFVHDLYATNQNLFRSSPVYQELRADLERHGLCYCIAERPFASAFPNGTALRVYRDAERTLTELRRHSPADAEGWRRLTERFGEFSTALLPLFNLPLPSAAAGVALARGAAAVGLPTLIELFQLLMASPRELATTHFATPEAQALVATWGMHLDFGPDVVGGSAFPLLESFGAQQEGIAIVAGGASKMVEALTGLLREHGGEVRTDADVDELILTDGRASGVRLVSGETIAAKRAVIANLTPGPLFGRLLRNASLPASLRPKVAAYRYGPATMMLHLALDGSVPWLAGEELASFGYVHLAPYLDDLARTYTQAQNGLLPDSPLLIVGQTTAVDPSRAPEGKQILWVQVRALPREIQGDAAGVIDARNWDAAKEPFAERVLDKLEAYAPGVRQRIIGQTVFSPADLERDNPSLVGGDSVGGSHHLRQYFLFRPFPGASRYRLPIEGLLMTGAGTWPGGGTSGTSGYLAAQTLLRSAQLQRRLALGGAVVGSVAALAAARRLLRQG